MTARRNRPDMPARTAPLPPEAELAAACELLRQERWDDARAAVDRALTPAAGAAHIDPADAAAPPTAPLPPLLRAELLICRAHAGSETGRLDAAAADAAAALALAAAAPGRATVMALARLHQGRIQVRQQQLDAAATTLRGLLAELPPESTLTRVQAMMVLAVALTLSGARSASLDLNRQALALLDAAQAPELRERVRERAMLHQNLGADAWFLGRLDASLQHMQAARALWQGLAAASDSAARRVDLARQLMNLGGLFTSRRDFAAAAAHYAQAQAALVAARRRLPRRAPPARRAVLRALRAKCEMNRGYSLLEAGRADAACASLRAATRQYAQLHAGAGAPADLATRDDEARCWVNLAHALAAGRRERAAVWYERGLRYFDAQIESGRGQLAYEAANARLGWARALSAVRGAGAAAAAEQAASQFDQGCAALEALAALGQLQHASNWFNAWLQQARCAIDARPAPAAAALHARTLLAVLARTPRRRALDFEPHWRALGRGLAELEAWQAAAGAPGPGAPRTLLRLLAVALTSHLLGLLADLLGNAEPPVLRRHESALDGVVARLARAARAWPEAPHLPADWFLHSHGLRAQRSALAEGGGAPLAGLREMLAELRRLEEELLHAGRGEPGADAAPPRHDGPVDPAGLLAASGWTLPAGGLADDAARAARWLELNAQCEHALDEQVRAGRLPGALRLDARTLAAQLPRRSALVLLARDGAEGLCTICLRSDGNGGRFSSHAAPLPAPARGTDAAQLHARLRASLAARHAQGLRRAPDALRALAAAEAEPFEAAALDVQRYGKALASAMLLPVLEALAAAGHDEVALVPSGDLHWLPWLDLVAAEQPSGMRLAQYPSAGAWSQCHALAAPGGVPEPPAAARWAVVASPLREPPALPWADLEQRLALRLWNADAAGRMCAATGNPPALDGVNALLGLGHGAAPQGNLARAGLLLEAGAVFSAHELPRLRHVRHVLLSCCVLGCNDEVQGEAMGFLSAAFGYGARFGCGWLIEVPDAEACLFSLALQHALREAQAAALAGGGSLDWLGVFEAVRHGIAGARWPPGFGVWLEAELPAAVEAALAGGQAPGPWLNRYELLRDFDGGVCGAPPPALRQLVPWVVALGR